MSNRVVKFRAWDEQAKVMHNEFQSIKSGEDGNDWVIFTSDKQRLDNPDIHPFDNPHFQQQFKVMQFTGLYDKNGVEIYEGDVLYHPLQGYRQVVYPMCESMAAFGIVSGDGKRNTLQDAHALYKVVGNIYETHALLEDNK